MSIFVGIDIAARSFELAPRVEGKALPGEPYSQTQAGHAEAIKRLRSLKPRLIVMEATGIYHLDLAVALVQAGLPVSVINPKSFHHFAELKLSTSKTDRLDAALLAEYGERFLPATWTPPDADCLALRDIGRQINRLTGARAQAKNRLHALQAKQMTLSLLLEDEEEGIRLLDRRIDRLSAAAVELIGRHAVLSRHWQHMQAAKGVGEAAGIAILAELCVLPTGLKAAQVSRFAGLDVKQSQSGTSVNRPGRLSKAGNAYLRAALFMPAMCAVRHDARARAFHGALVKRGKKKIQAIAAIMRKYLTGLWACICTDKPFDSALLFSDLHMRD